MFWEPGRSRSWDKRLRNRTVQSHYVGNSSTLKSLFKLAPQSLLKLAPRSSLLSLKGHCLQVVRNLYVSDSDSGSLLRNSKKTINNRGNSEAQKGQELQKRSLVRKMAGKQEDYREEMVSIGHGQQASELELWREQEGSKEPWFSENTVTSSANKFKSFIFHFLSHRHIF